jgi:integrase
MAKVKKRPVLAHVKVSETSQLRAPFRVWYPVEDETGKPRRVFKSFASADAAWTFAENQDREISNHGVRYGDIPPEVRRAFDFYRDQVAELTSIGASVPKFEDLISSALSDIRLRHHEAAENALSVAEAVEAFVSYKSTRVKDRQLSDLKDRLKRFAQDFGTRTMQSITTEEIDKWLTGLRSRRNPSKTSKAPLLAPLSRNHHRAVLHALFGHGAAPARSWCSRNPVADLEPERVETPEPEAYSVEDVMRIMQTAVDHKPELVPVLALGMFGGLRISEAREIDLGKIKPDTDEFRVGADHKRGARIVPCTAALRSWLFAQPRRRGKAWLKEARSSYDAMQELFALAGVDAIDNGARHSFISYRCAESRDIARVADECGNSVITIKKHYRQLVTAADAERFFKIRPASPRGKKSKITDITKGRASA